MLWVNCFPASNVVYEDLKVIFKCLWLLKFPVDAGKMVDNGGKCFGAVSVCGIPVHQNKQKISAPETETFQTMKEPTIRHKRGEAALDAVAMRRLCVSSWAEAQLDGGLPAI